MYHPSIYQGVGQRKFGGTPAPPIPHHKLPLIGDIATVTKLVGFKVVLIVLSYIQNKLQFRKVFFNINYKQFFSSILHCIQNN